MIKRISMLGLLVSLFAFGVNACPTCSGNWNQVASGTLATGSSGQIGSIWIDGGVTFQCQAKPTPPPTPTPTTPTQTQQQNQNQNQTANGGSATATGGSSNSSSNSGVTNSGNSSSSATGGSVNNSGNSSNTNKNTNNNNNVANGGQGGAGGSATSVAGASSSSNNNSSGNSTSYSSVYHAAAATAFANASPTAPCIKGYGVGGQMIQGGISISGGKVDETCEELETARSFLNAGARLAYCKEMVISKYAKKAGITLEDCLKMPEPVVAPVVEPAPAPQPIIINPPAVTLNVPPVPAPIAVETHAEQKATLFEGHFRMDQTPGSGICPAPHAIVTDAGKVVLDRAIANAGSTGTVILVGNPKNTIAAMRYLSKSIDKSRVSITIDDSQNSTVTVKSWSVGQVQ